MNEYNNKNYLYLTSLSKTNIITLMISSIFIGYLVHLISKDEFSFLKLTFFVLSY